jgi:zinc protease
MALAGACALAGCSQGSRLVAPLHYVSTPGADPHVTAQPAVDATVDRDVPFPTVREATLDDGVRLVVAERHAFPAIAARLVMVRDALDVNDAPSLDYLGPTFLVPSEAGEDASAGCGPAGCFAADVGATGEVSEVIDRLASLVAHPRESRDAFARRLKAAAASVRSSGFTPEAAFVRNARALAFGRSAYGEPEELAAPPSLTNLEALRDDIFQPLRATLVVVGDVSFDEVLAAARQVFSGWVSTFEGHPEAPHRDLPPRVEPKLVMVDNSVGVEARCGLVVRGPAPSSADAAAFTVASRVLGGGMDSAAFRAVRENLEAAYAVGANTWWFPSGSMLVLGGPVQEDKTIDALEALTAAVRDIGRSGPPPGAVNTAKAAMLGGLRHVLSSNAAIASAMGDRVLAGGPVDLRRWANELQAVSEADVTRIAARYFGAGAIGAVVVGSAYYLEPWLGGLGFGQPQRRDGFARIVDAVMRDDAL